MKFNWALVLICVLNIKLVHCIQVFPDSENATVMETLQQLKRELEDVKQQMKEDRVQRCKVDNPVSEHSNNLRRSVLPGSAVGFTACVSVPDLKSLGIHHTILFDHVITNTGGAYHPTTGIFTAPFKGLYVFAATAMSVPGKTQYLQIVKDGVIINYFLADSRGSQGFEVTGNQWVLELDQGSEVWIQTPHAGEIHGNCYTLFSGFLLSEIE